MNKYLFEDWLRNRLDDLPPEELDRVCAFYLSAIDDRMEDGMTEEEAIYALGEPEQLLVNIRASLPETVTYDRPQRGRIERKNRRQAALAAVIVVCALGVVFSLVTGIFALNIGTTTHVAVPEPAPPMAVEVTEIFPGSSDSSYWEQGCEDWPQEAWEIINFDIEADLGSITLEPSPDDIIHIWTNDPGSLTLTQRGSSLYAEQDMGDLIVQIPAMYQSQLVVDIRADLGDVKLYDCRPRSLNVYADLGSIHLSHMTVDEHMRLEADFGSISGSIADAQENYSISVSADFFKSNLPEESGAGEKKLEITCDVGTVVVEFER